jgi:hypothetical protein
MARRRKGNHRPVYILGRLFSFLWPSCQHYLLENTGQTANENSSKIWLELSSMRDAANDMRHRALNSSISGCSCPSMIYVTLQIRWVAEMGAVCLGHLKWMNCGIQNNMLMMQ